LSSPFSAYSDAASLSYAQSFSVVNYLIATHGQSKMLELLNTFREGSAYNSAFEKVYGFTINQLNDQWKQYLQKQNTSQIQPRFDKVLTGSILPLRYSIRALG
jgi:hypothetical protein